MSGPSSAAPAGAVPTVPAVHWRLARFDELTTHGLYGLLQLRAEVFVVEQNCAFQDLDGIDAQSVHLLGTRQGTLVAYARCMAAGATFKEASIGRVVTRPAARGNGLGHQLIAQALQAVVQLWGAQPIRIGAQAHLKNFYESHGFQDMTLPYVEDGIDHLEMLYTPAVLN